MKQLSYGTMRQWNNETMNLEVSPELAQRAYLNILEDMQEEKKAMGDQRTATFNILEDINESQEQLKKRYEELEILRNLVEELGTSLKVVGVFEKFFRADNARTVASDGNGLGLYLVKQIMDSSGGGIGFDSDPGKGTTFYVTIPLTGMKSKQGEKGLEG